MEVANRKKDVWPTQSLRRWRWPSIQLSSSGTRRLDRLLSTEESFQFLSHPTSLGPELTKGIHFLHSHKFSVMEFYSYTSSFQDEAKDMRIRSSMQILLLQQTTLSNPEAKNPVANLLRRNRSYSADVSVITQMIFTNLSAGRLRCSRNNCSKLAFYCSNFYRTGKMNAVISPFFL